MSDGHNELKVQDNLFSIDRKRAGGWITLSYEYFMSNYPHFDKLPNFTFTEKGSSGVTMSTKSEGSNCRNKEIYVTEEDYKMIHKYICLCEGKDPDYKVFSFNFWKSCARISSKELEPREYDRVCRLSKHIAIAHEDRGE